MASAARALPAPGQRRARPGRSALTWPQTHDRGLLALRRATRTAIVMPIVLVITARLIGNPVTATFRPSGAL
ncbi:MAG: hypothetical protein M3Y09_08600 [Actinomycetota bacterium]|nr:hypothetical protein [Actinomycetota bacterium]